MTPDDPIKELQTLHLYNILTEASPEYAIRIETFIKMIAPILATTREHFPLYTRHDAHHGFRVVRRVQQILKPEFLQMEQMLQLTPTEMFLLIAAAYAHDLGMTVFPGEEASLLKELGLDSRPGWETNQILQSHLRREHSNRGGKYIADHAETLGIPINLISALDKMMRAHNLSISDLEDMFSQPYAAEERRIDIKQLSIILCIADALEFSDTRVIDGVLAKIELDPSEAARVSYKENMKHVSISDGLAVTEDGQVIVSGSFQDEKVLALAHQTLDQMEGWIRGYCDIDRRSMHPRLKIRPEPFARNLEFLNGRFERLGIRLDKRNVIGLIASNAVWRRNEGMAVRELIQNAVEACRYRTYHSSNADHYKPEVTVVFDRHLRTVTITDNGCGMSERTVLNNFLTVGSSRSSEPAYRKDDYAPIARFGIGFWSVFTISKRARITTAAFEATRGLSSPIIKTDGIAFEVCLDEFKDYTIFHPMECLCGTKVELSLCDEIVFDDVYSRGRNLLFCSEVPITFTLDGRTDQVPCLIPSVSNYDILGSRTRLTEDLGVKLFFWRGTIGNTELTLGLAYRIFNGKATFLVRTGRSLLNVMGDMRHPKTSICGFSVRLRFNPICFDINRVGVFFANYRTPRGIEFSLDRQSILINDASNKFTSDIAYLVHEGYRSFLTLTGSFDNEAVNALCEQAAMHGGNVYDSFTGLELSTAVVHYPDLLSMKLVPVKPNTLYDQVDPVYMNLKDLQQQSGTILSFQTDAIKQASGERAGFLNPEDENALRLTYSIAHDWALKNDFAHPIYVAAPSRLASMLFDADPDSSVMFASVYPVGDVCVMTASLDRMNFQSSPAGILAELHGRWAGAIYLRAFKTPDSKPYVFLGRGRVLIERSSKLSGHLKTLIDDGRLMSAVEVIVGLKDDEEGYPPEALAEYLKGE